MSKVKSCGHSSDGDSIQFYCPGCNEMHIIQVTGVAPWTWNGSSDSPTFSPSVLVRSGHYVPGHNTGSCWCTWKDEHPEEGAPFSCQICHSYVIDGCIRFLGDCTHELAGQTVPLPEID